MTFEDAIRVYFNAPANTIVTVADNVFAATSGCDTCGYGSSYDTSVTVTALDPVDSRKFYKTETFESIPELWKALA